MPEAQRTVPWSRAKAPFAAVFTAPALWLFWLFFLVPLAVIWAYSFGRTVGLTDIAIDGTFSNYARIADPVYVEVFVKSLAYAALTTFLCLIVGFPVALAITFAGPKAKVWLLLLIMLPFWTNLLVRTYALMAVLQDRGLRQRHHRLGRARAAGRCSTTISRSWWGWSTSTCPSWCCRSIRRSTGSIARCWRRASISAPGTSARSSRWWCRWRCPASSRAC